MSMIKTLAAGAVAALALGATAAEAAGHTPPNPGPVEGGGTAGCNGKPTCGGTTTPDPVKPAPITVTGTNTATSGSTSAAEADARAAADAKAKAAATANNAGMTLTQHYEDKPAAAPVVLGSDGSGYCTKGKAAGISLVEVGLSARGYGPDMDCVNTVAQYDLAEDALKETFKAVKDGIATPAAAGVAFAGTIEMIPQWKAAYERDTSALANMFMSQSRAVSITPPAGAPVQATEQGAPVVKCPPKTRWNGSVCEFGQP